MKLFSQFISAAMLAFFIFGCASTTPINSAQLAVIGAKQFASGADIFYVPTHGALGDASFIAVSQSQPSAQAQQLAQAFLSTAKAPVNIVIGGPNSKKTAVVVENAVDLCADAQLKGLHLIFVGLSEHGLQLQKLLVAKGASFELYPIK